MNVHLLETELWLPQPLEEVFRFFADAHNLEAITPDWLHFDVLTPGPIEMRVGTLIDYHLKVHGMPIRWRSEITAWEPPHRFVDEQRRGPYRLWTHEHLFASQGAGTVVTDRVRYAVPGGEFLHRLFVKADVERIFAFRRDRLVQMFPPTAPSPAPCPAQ